MSIFKFLLQMPNRPLPIEFEEFEGENSVSKQAFSKARQNIEPEASRELAQVSVQNELNGIKDYDDYRGYTSRRLIKTLEEAHIKYLM